MLGMEKREGEDGCVKNVVEEEDEEVDKDEEEEDVWEEEAGDTE